MNHFYFYSVLVVSTFIHFSSYSVLVLDKPNLWNVCTVTALSAFSLNIIVQLQKDTQSHISKFFFSRFRLPTKSIPQREKIRSTYASDAGADRSNSSGARLWYTAWRSIQNCLQLVPPNDWSSIMYLSSCCWGEGPCVLPACVSVISAARNMNFCSTGAATKEVLAVVESELSVACWVSFTACSITYNLVERHEEDQSTQVHQQLDPSDKLPPEQGWSWWCLAAAYTRISARMMMAEMWLRSWLLIQVAFQVQQWQNDDRQRWDASLQHIGVASKYFKNLDHLFHFVPFTC